MNNSVKSLLIILLDEIGDFEDVKKYLLAKFEVEHVIYTLSLYELVE